MARKKAVRGRAATRQGKKNKKGLIILSVFILVVFIVGLYFLQSNSTVDPDSLPKVETTNVKPKAELPTPPEERWSYIKALETRTVVNHSDKKDINNSNLTAEQKRILAQMVQEQNKTTSKSTIKVEKANKTSSVKINTAKSFGLQCGAFKKYQQAESQLVKLTMLGVSAHIKSSGGWHRVFVGPIGSRAEANNQLNQVKSNVNCLVIAM